MNTFRSLSGLLLIVVLILTSCNPNKTPKGYVEFQGKNYKEPTPVMFDSNGDGTLDAKVEVLGANINTNTTAKGKPLFVSSRSYDDTTGIVQSLVPTGKRLCYFNLSRNCDSYGALYAFETTMNTDFDEILEASKTHVKDTNDDGVQDYIQNIRNNEISQLVAFHKEASALLIKAELESAATSPKIISAYFIENKLDLVLKSSLTSALYEKNDYIDLLHVRQVIFTVVNQLLHEIVDETDFTSVIPSDEIESVLISISNAISQSIVEDLAETVAVSLFADYEELKTSGTLIRIQGLCPDGYHIPTDTEWMMFEMALGMPVYDLTKSGETVIDRGASAQVAEKMIADHGFDYSGYMSINGTYAQLGEAGVFWSSTAGVDEKGEYVWVRQIDKSFPGVIRYKHYEKSGLSVRCFKD